MAGRARGHLRLVGPDEVASFDPATVIESSLTAQPVDTEVVFSCPDCGRRSGADGHVRNRWCTGTHNGTRTHAPVQMTRTEPGR